ncbi:MAG: carboxypeptidase M32 [Sphingobacteriales bacterium]|nr:MAG: carboxypeptidase M32 [Sphingobacteriales bacterium]
MSTKNSAELYDKYVAITQKAADLNYASAVLGWDQEVYMPPKGEQFRGRQLATLSTLAHEMLTSKEYGELLQQLSQAEPDETQAANIRLSIEDYEKNKQLPSSFIDELTRQTSASYNAWMKARKANDFSIYAPELEKMIQLKRKQAELYGFEGHPYDALLDDYEKGATVAMLDPIFESLKKDLPPLLQKLQQLHFNDGFFYRDYPKQQQWDFSMAVLKKMGYDMEAGRQDISEHPFTTSFAPTDVRVTTRVDEHNFASLLWSSIHEGGHALYEQGLPEEQYGLPLGAAASLSIHESQSRLWENCVGRSKDFWKYFYIQLQGEFPRALFDITQEHFWEGVNKVQPSLIRTEADEVSYHFHVMIRYEIEKALIEGSLDVKDLKQAWNDMYREYIGVTPKDDLTGVLQDIHWSHGSFGYFPTYSLGSFYAAQFFQQAQKDIVGLNHQIASGEFTELLKWLRKNIHRHGRRYRSDELCKMVTGKGLSLASFMSYLNDKYANAR